MAEAVQLPTGLPTHLPPPEAWNNPQKWLRFESSEVVGINPDVVKLTLPTDDRKFVLGSEAVRMVRGLFHPDYIWRYDPRDQRTRPDLHHWYNHAAYYKPENFNGSLIPKIFREIPTNQAYIQRMFHMTIHDVAHTPEIPDMEDMEQHLKAYMLSYQIFSRMFKTGRNVLKNEKLAAQRRKSIESNPSLIMLRPHDEIGERYFTDQIRKYMNAYAIALDQAIERGDSVLPEFMFRSLDEIEEMPPRELVTELGRVGLIRGRKVSYVNELLRAA